MGLNANVIFEIQTGGSDTNGGGFKSTAGTTDYSQQTTAQLALTDAVTDGTTTITSATGGFTAAMVGNLLYITGGTGSITAARYEITGYTDTNTITVDRSTGLTAGSGATLNVGGCLASLGELTSPHVFTNGNKIYIKEGTYTLTTATPGSGGPFSGVSNARYQIFGYASAGGRDDRSAKPYIDFGAITGVTAITVNGSSTRSIVENLEIDGNDNTGTRGLYNSAGSGSNGSVCRDMILRNLPTGTTGFDCWRCEAYSCGVGLDAGGYAGNCYAQDCSTEGMGMNTIIHCIAAACGIGFNTVRIANHCVAVNCTGNGFGIGSTNAFVQNCISAYNGGYGFAGNSNGQSIHNCAGISNTSGFTSNITGDFDSIALSADPFTDKANYDFTLNNTAGGGADCRTVTLAGTITQTDYADLGALYRDADSSGGGGGGVNRLTGRGLAG